MSNYDNIYGGDYIIKKCKKVTGVAVFLILVLLCFCCSVSSSFAALFWKRTTICSSTCNACDSSIQDETVELDEVAETFRVTSPNVNANNDIIYDNNAYRTRNQIY